MYKPVFRVTEFGENGGVVIDIGDVDIFGNGQWNSHFTICILPLIDAFMIENNHTHERVEFKGQSAISCLLDAHQYAYDVYYKKGRKMDKEKVGVMLTKTWKEAYKNFLSKPLLRAISEVEKKFGEDWLVSFFE